MMLPLGSPTSSSASTPNKQDTPAALLAYTLDNVDSFAPALLAFEQLPTAPAAHPNESYK